MSTNERPNAIITGATSPIGERVAHVLAERGYRITIAARVVDHARATVGRITGDIPDADITIERCDLASLDSVRTFAETVANAGNTWDVLLHTATAELAPYRMLTDDGFEWNFGINYLATFALSGLLQPSAAPDARTITTTSPTATSATLKFYDLRWDNGYRPGRAYASSRLATLIHTVEHARRLAEKGSAQSAIVTHPGFIQERPRLGNTGGIAERLIGHSAYAGAETAVFALDTTIPNGAFVAPSGPGQLRGGPAVATVPDIATNSDEAARLWRVSQQLTGVSWL